MPVRGRGPMFPHLGGVRGGTSPRQSSARPGPVNRCGGPCSPPFVTPFFFMRTERQLVLPGFDFQHLFPVPEVNRMIS